jgi:hypothetical protein
LVHGVFELPSFWKQAAVPAATAIAAVPAVPAATAIAAVYIVTTAALSIYELDAAIKRAIFM